MPTDPASSAGLGRRLAVPAVGLMVALAWAALMLTFPILTGSDLHARIQSAVATALGFPLMSAARFVVPAAGRLGLAPFAVGVALAFLNGVFWAGAVVTVRGIIRHRRDPGVSLLPPAA